MAYLLDQPVDLSFSPPLAISWVFTNLFVHVRFGMVKLSTEHTITVTRTPVGEDPGPRIQLLHTVSDQTKYYCQLPSFLSDTRINTRHYAFKEAIYGSEQYSRA